MMAEETRTVTDDSSSHELQARPWHTIAHEDVLAAYRTRAEGLSAAQAAERLLRVGPNRLPQAAKRGVLARLFAQIHNVLIYVLLLSAIISLMLDHAVDAAVIFAVVIVNAVIGFIQEGRAEQALEAIAGDDRSQGLGAARWSSHDDSSGSNRAGGYRHRRSGRSRARRFAFDSCA